MPWNLWQSFGFRVWRHSGTPRRKRVEPSWPLHLANQSVLSLVPQLRFSRLSASQIKENFNAGQTGLTRLVLVCSMTSAAWQWSYAYHSYESSRTLCLFSSFLILLETPWLIDDHGIVLVRRKFSKMSVLINSLQLKASQVWDAVASTLLLLINFKKAGL